MRFKEFFKPNYDKNYKALIELGAITFNRGITEKEETRTPHYMMDKCLNIATENPIVSPAINQLIDYIIPGGKIIIKSSDEKSVKFVEKWHQLRPGIIREYRNILFTNIANGNGALQHIYNSKGEFDNIKSINDTSRLYYNPDYKDPEEKFVYELPLTIKMFTFNGEPKQPEFYRLKYIANNTFIYKMVWGIPISGNDVVRYLSGWSRDGYYGRSQLASGIDVNNIMSEIMSSWDSISKMKQIDQKILTPDPSSGMYDFSNLSFDKFAEMLNNPQGSYTFLPMPLKLLQQDIKVAKGYDLMEGVFDILRRMIIMNLLPIHLTSWGDSSTTQGSQMSMPPYLARITNKQIEFSKFLTRAVIGKLREEYTWLADDLEITFPKSNVMGDDYYIKIVSSLKRESIITTKQAQKMLLDMGVLNKDLINEYDRNEDLINPFLVSDKDSLQIDYNLASRSDKRKKELEKDIELDIPKDSKKIVDKELDNKIASNKKLAKDELERRSNERT